MADPAIFTYIMNALNQSFGSSVIVGFVLLFFSVFLIAFSRMDASAWGYFAILIVGYLFLFNLVPASLFILALGFGAVLVALAFIWMISGGGQ